MLPVALLGTLTFLERGKEIVSCKVYKVIQKDRIRTQRGKKIPKRRVQCSATDDFLLLHTCDCVLLALNLLTMCV